MPGIALTRDLAFAAGQDAGNRSMKTAGRTAWNDDDWNAAAVETNRLLRHVPEAEGGLMGIPEEELAAVGL